MHALLVLLLSLALVRGDDEPSFNRTVAVLVVDGTQACQWAKARLFDALGCAVSVTVRDPLNVAGGSALRGTGISMVQYAQNHSRLDSPAVTHRFKALNGRTPRIVCFPNEQCHAIRRASHFAEAVALVEQRVRAEAACQRRHARSLGE